ncbi:uncharacterized protein LOC143178315 [Calliopsis andreniformis]|uniref:uncharacterized protein LOC143178315 n=1 Tax=Calliopsis andreniformis TaxID=337506 RepID=UPI003FCC471F
MSHINQQSQDNTYGQLARKLFKIATLSGSKVVLRRGNQGSDVSTEFLQEFGTTDVAIGDVTAEIMLTTLGKIPNEMYYLEDTVAPVTVATPKIKIQQARYGEGKSSPDNANNESESHPSVLFALLIALLILLLLCCTTACLIAKAKRKSNFFGRSDTECDPGCTGINQPLLGKVSDCTNKTSISSLRN